MIKTISRRLSLKVLALGSLFGFTTRRPSLAQEEPEEKLDRLENWGNTSDRVFLGGEVWANPMEDWRVADGWAECITGAGNRSIHSLTHRLTNPAGSISMSVRISRTGAAKKDGGAGFRIGVRSDLNEHRSNCFAKGGITAGLIGGELRLANRLGKLTKPAPPSGFRLILTGNADREQMKLPLKAMSEDGVELGSIRAVLPAANVLGNIAVVSNYDGASKKHRYELAHQKGSGFGLATIDTRAKTYHIESFRFLIDATDGKKSNQFPGWPVTIHQKENRGENQLH